MNSILKKKLASYSAATASLLAVNPFSSEAQIIYTDIPDTFGVQTSLGDYIVSSYDLDLNNDGIVDFKIHGHLLTYTPYGTADSAVWVSASGNGNEIVKHNISIERLECGETISAQANFASGGFLRVETHSGWTGSGNSTSTGLWDDSSPHLMGLKLVVGSDTLYGWVRLRVVNVGEFEIFDYAYNSTPDQEIVACDTSSFATSASIKNGEQSSIKAFVNAHNLTVIVSNNLLPNTLRVMNILGEPILSKEIIKEKNEINLSAFPTGIYIVTIGDEKSQWTRKISLSH